MANVKTAANPATAGDPKANKKMAKAMKKEQKKAEKGGKKKIWLIILLIFIVLAGGFTALVAFDVFGLRTNVILPMLRNLPIVGGMFAEAEYDPETGLPIQTYSPADTIAGLEAQILELENQLERTIADNAAVAEERDVLYTAANEDLMELDRLREIEEHHLEILADRERFEREIAENNIDAFVNFFETMHPETAEEIFAAAAGQHAMEERWQNYLSSWGSASPITVARVIESMATTDMPMIARVMVDLPVNQRVAIINQLSIDTAALLYRQMYPN
ncbi:MAG: hypothetical protein FWE21_01520 [Defluviitaleaceae bacterium]|nr:hypothetical protein [Defluviitaleaceae bacterium]